MCGGGGGETRVARPARLGDGDGDGQWGGRGEDLFLCFVASEGIRDGVSDLYGEWDDAYIDVERWKGVSELMHDRIC